MSHWSGRWALVTGASAGIGRALAEQLAAAGANLILTARRKERLAELAAQLASNHNIQADAFAADLADPGAPAAIFAFTQGKGIHVDVLINNAGFGGYGSFHTQARERQLDMVQVNCAAVVHLTHLYLPAMVERRQGDILIVASAAAFQAVPFITTYAATKAFDLLFAEGLAEEVAQHNVRVCALCPGSTTTEFHDVAGQPARLQRSQETADKVARVGLQALAAGKSCVISGAKNILQTHTQRLVPRRFVTRMAANLFRPR
jgi:hypothetical protein